MRSRRGLLVATTLALSACAPPPSSGETALAPQCNQVRVDSVYAALRASGDTMDDEVLAPRLLSHPPLHYPESLRERGINGEVEYQFVIETDGGVDPCTIRTIRASDTAFVHEGAAMIAGARFQPARRDGHPIPIIMHQKVGWSVGGVQGGA